MALTTRLADAPTQQTLADYMGTTVDGTDDIVLVRDALNHFLGTSRYVATYLPGPAVAGAARCAAKGSRRDDFGRLADRRQCREWLASPGYPGGTIYHYVAVVGYDQDGALALIADPAGDGAGGSSWTNVPRTYWISVDDLGTWIGAKGYTH